MSIDSFIPSATVLKKKVGREIPTLCNTIQVGVCRGIHGTGIDVPYA